MCSTLCMDFCPLSSSVWPFSVLSLSLSLSVFRFGAFSCADCYQKVRSGGPALWAYLTTSTASTQETPERDWSRNRATTYRYPSRSQLPELKQTDAASCCVQTHTDKRFGYLTEWCLMPFWADWFHLLLISLCAVRWTVTFTQWR